MSCVCVCAPHLTGEDGLPSLLWAVEAILSKEIWARAEMSTCYNKRGNSSGVNLVWNDAESPGVWRKWRPRDPESAVMEYHTVVHSSYYNASLWLYLHIRPESQLLLQYADVSLFKRMSSQTDLYSAEPNLIKSNEDSNVTESYMGWNYT